MVLWVDLSWGRLGLRGAVGSITALAGCARPLWLSHLLTAVAGSAVVPHVAVLCSIAYNTLYRIATPTTLRAMVAYGSRTSL